MVDYWQGNIPWATAKDVANAGSRYLDKVQESIAENGLTDSAAKLMLKGTVGVLAQFWREMAFNQTCYVLTPTSRIDNNFLYYALKGTLPIMQILTYGTVFQTITRKSFNEWRISFPPLHEQRAIAHVIRTPDDKAELNRRTNETLEEMARALFKSWFVDFDPVHAKMGGRWWWGESLPGLPVEYYDLFPDRLVHSELGEIPEDWKVKTLGELADVSSGKRPGRRFPAANDEARIPLWGGNGPMGFVATPLMDSLILLTGRVGTLGSVFRITTPCWPSDNTLFVTAKSSQFFSYLFFHMEMIDFDSLNRGSTQPLLTQSDLKAQLVILPLENVLKCFHSLNERLFDSNDLRKHESRVLAALRGTMLPKLISGDVRVGN